MFSQTVEYALRAVVVLASQPGTPMTTQRIATGTHVPAGYLSKVLQNLGRAGIVHSQRGVHGGFRLTRDPADLNVLEVVNAVDPIRRINTCPLGLEAHGTQLCPLHRRLDDALAYVEQAFRESTIADLIDQPGQNKPLCNLTVEGETAE